MVPNKLADLWCRRTPEYPSIRNQRDGDDLSTTPPIGPGVELV